MEYRILLIKDINFENIRYSPIKKSSSQNRYSYITYFNQEEEIQNVVIQSRQMNILELSKNEKGHYHITFQLNSFMKNFLEKFEHKINKDLQQFRSEKLYKYIKENKSEDSENIESIQNIYPQDEVRDTKSVTLSKSENSLPSEFSEGKKSSSPLNNKHSVSFQSQNEYEDGNYRSKRKIDEKHSHFHPLDKVSINPKNNAEIENLSIETESGILPIDFQKNSLISDPAFLNTSEPTEDRYSDAKGLGFRLEQAATSGAGSNASLASTSTAQKKGYKFRSSISEYNNHYSIKCKIGHISNLVVFDQYKKMYDEESEIIKLLKIPNAVVVPIIECLGLWISNEDEAGISWVCHHVKVIQSNTLFKKYLFIDENSDESDPEDKIMSKNKNSSKQSLGYTSQSAGQGNFSLQKKSINQKTDESHESNIKKLDKEKNIYPEEDIQYENNDQKEFENYDSFRRWKKNLPEKVVVDRT